jgi:DNA primase
MDPDDFVRERGAEAYLEALRGSKPAIEFLTEEVAAGADLSHPRARAEAVNRLLPFVARLRSPVERTGYLAMIADRLRVDEDVLRAELREALKSGRRRVSAPGPVPEGPERPPAGPPLNLAEGRLLAILASNPQVREALRLDLEPEDFAGSRAEPILRTLLEQGMDDPSLEPARLAGLLPDEASRSLLARVILEQEEEGGSESEARSCLSAIRRTRLKRERDRVQRQLERNRDAAALEELMARKMELSRQIDALS